ncbi:hypothetical protein M9H77_26784 [Catharanthus roseus]|uniref:Uncharacterized protein n=1 Tax=Catharanthus roseus TaxID=4058 RepID=A0ACC0AEQ9_CATRO|nr:hypothetical protein M9H77_26784 [Catharanthus roseus]
MENQIELLSRMIIEKLLSNIPSNTITLRDVEGQVMMFPMFMDDEDETTQEAEESTFPRSQEPLLITTVVEKSKKVENLPENRNEHEGDELERETESCVENNRYHKHKQQETEIDESWKRLKENDEERRRLMKFRENFKKAKRDQSLCYEKARMKFTA